WPDLNRRPLDPQSSALTKLRHSPYSPVSLGGPGLSFAVPGKIACMGTTKSTCRLAAAVAASTAIAAGLLTVGAPAASAQSAQKKPTPPLWSPPTTSATPQFSGTASNGATGDAVKAVEQRLDALHYFTGTVDSTFDDETAHAVTAFQKVNNLPRTG